MQPYLYVKLILIIFFIPAAFGLTWFAKRQLKEENSLRQLIERRGIYKVAQYLLFGIYALGGVVLTVLYN